MSRHDALAPLRQRDFGWYFASRVADTLGTMMSSVALAFAVLEVTDSATALGQVLAAHTVPLVALLLFGGVLADRLPRVVVLQGSNVLAAASMGVLALLVVTDVAELWMFLVLAAVNGAADAAGLPAMSGMVPQLVARDQLQPANALLSLARGALTVIGPTVSALLVASVGPGWSLALNAGAWLLSAALLLPVRVPGRQPSEQGSTMLSELREGWSVFTGTTWLWVVVLAFAVLNAIHSGLWFTLGPVVARDTIGIPGWGLVLSAESAGMLAMTLVLLRVRMRRPLLVGMLGCALFGLPLLALGLRPELVLLVATALLAGVGFETFGIGWNLALQENVEEAMLSRAYSYDALGSFAAMPVGQLLAGPLGDAFGARRVLVTGAAVYAVVALATLASRSVRRLDRTPLTPPGEPTAPPASG